ncbi:MAG TPA: hypothetical protein VGR11_08810 [Solirubrobacteraceae bacterium]|nr:hypothetical protein [Solirubrobacteraceae bacterium]
MHPGLLLSLVVLATTVPAAQAAAQPSVSTGGVQAVSTTGAVLTGAVNPRGEDTTVFFRYGPTQAYGARTPNIAVGNGTKKVAVSAAVSGLAPGTRYHYRLVAVGGTARGTDRTFRTKALPAPLIPQPSKLELARATIFRTARVIDILAPITRRASGNVDLELYAAGRRHRWSAPINSAAGRIRDSERIPAAQASLGTGILTITYPGDPDTRPQRVRLRAANVPAALDARRPTLTAGRLQAGGTISSAARGVVRVQLQYFSAGTTTTLEKHATISNGKWILDAPLTAEEQAAILQRQGTVHSYILFTGYLPLRMRGEMQSYQVLGPA